MCKCRYLAPEYASSGKLTYKYDVFSYGVMLLELISGRRPIDINMMEDSLVDLLIPLFWIKYLATWNQHYFAQNLTVVRHHITYIRARPIANEAMESGNYDKLVDPRLENNYVPHEMARMVAAAVACVRHSG